MSQEYRVFAKFVRRVQRRLYQRRLLQGGVLIGTVALALLLLGVAVQPLIPRQPLAPVIYSAIGVLAVLALIVYVLRPAVRWVTQRQALARIEETYPGSHDDLRNALQLDAETLGARQPARRGARLGAGVAPAGRSSDGQLQRADRRAPPSSARRGLVRHAGAGRGWGQSFAARRPGRIVAHADPAPLLPAGSRHADHHRARSRRSLPRAATSTCRRR